MNPKSRSWTILTMLTLLGAGPLLRAQAADPAAAMLESAIQKQWVSGDVEGAIRQYEQILARYGSQRRIAAQALWRLGLSQEQVGRLDDAGRSYKRLLREHADQPALVEAARTRLAGLAEEEEYGPDLGRDVVARDMVANTESWEEWLLRKSSGSVNPEGPVVFSDLAVYDPRNGQTRRLLPAARSAAYPVMSPNGQQIAYLSWSGDLNDPAEVRRVRSSAPRATGELRVVSIGGAGDRPIAGGQGIRWLRPFDWTPDNSAVLVLLERTSGMRDIALVSVRTGSMRVLKSMPWLSAQDLRVSNDGNFVAYQVPSPRGEDQYEFFILPASDDARGTPERRYGLTLSAQRGARVTADDLIIHVLNRTGFGPRPGDVERVRTMGIDAYIDQQLRPEQIADPVVDGMIGHFRSLKMEIPELLEKAGPPVDIAERRRASIFSRPALVARSEAASKAPGAGLMARAASDPPRRIASDRPMDLEVQTARMIRAVHSQRQLNEVVVDFWMNHFNVNLGDEILTPSFEEQTIRQHALGRFEDLLLAVARHPQMLSYLDNWLSSAPADVLDKRLGEQRQQADVEGQLAILERRAFLAQSKGLNENYARELLELHTMGVDSGYTQKDIIEVAKILSGWTIGTRGFVNAREQDGIFMFDPLMHVDGDKVVLGQTFKSGGVDEGIALLKMLAHRPETARFISTKLARRFIADTPPQTVIDAASETFMRTGGDLREVLRTILKSPQFRSSEAMRVKIKKPFELVASALRAVNASIDELDAYATLLTGNRSYISRMGEKMYNHEAPDGNPDVGPAWMNSNALLLRLEFVNALTAGRIRGITPDLGAGESLLTQLGVPRPTPLQIDQHHAMLQASAPVPMGSQADKMMMAAPDAAARKGPEINPAAITVAVMLGSPQFQKR